MTEDEIFDQLSNSEFKLNTSLLLWQMHTNITRHSFVLCQILKEQLEIKELLQGTAQEEAEMVAVSKVEELEKTFTELLQDTLIDDLNFFSTDDE